MKASLLSLLSARFVLRASATLFAATLIAAFFFGCHSPSSNANNADESFASDLNDSTQPEEGLTHILIAGDDSWGSFTPGKSDLMLLMSVNFSTSNIYLTTIPRDTVYEWEDGSVTKANEAYRLEGIEGAKKAAEQITGISVDNYIIVNFDGLQSIVEYFDGITVDLPYAINYDFYTHDYPDEYYEAGEQVLTPWRTMALTRARTGYSPYGLNEDMMRQTVNRQLLVNLAAKVFENPTEAASVIEDLLPCIQTDIPASTAVAWATQLAQSDGITFYGNSGPAEGDIDSASGLYLIPYSESKWSKLTDAVLNGEDLSSVNAQFMGTKQSDIAPVGSKTVIELNASTSE